MGIHLWIPEKTFGPHLMEEPSSLPPPPFGEKFCPPRPLEKNLPMPPQTTPNPGKNDNSSMLMQRLGGWYIQLLLTQSFRFLTELLTQSLWRILVITNPECFSVYNTWIY